MINRYSTSEFRPVSSSIILIYKVSGGASRLLSLEQRKRERERMLAPQVSQENRPGWVLRYDCSLGVETRKTIGIRRHIVSLLLITLLATIVYSRVTLAYFCGYDDFFEARRAALVDQFDVNAVFITTHYNSFKYRPLSRAVNLLTYLMHPGDALQFRLRNLAFHELAGSCVYVLALLLFESWPAACIAALLFLIHPLANQTVDAADWTNTIANSIFLGSLIFFLLSLRREKIWLLILSVACSVIDVLFYEAAIMLPVLMTTWWAIDSLAKRRLPKLSYVAVFLVANLLLFGSYLLFRQHVVHGAGTSISTPFSIVKGLMEYVAALLLPFDMVLANAWFHTPLPSELLTKGLEKVALAAAVGLCVLAIVVFRFRGQIARATTALGWSNIWLLLSAMLLSILPLVVFTDHVSETYVYLPLAFFCILLGRALTLIRPPAARNITVSFLVLSFCCATWVRNERVYTCGSEAKRILSTLAAPAFRTGHWRIDVAKTVGTTTHQRFGIYNYHGLDTLGTGDGGLGDFGLQGVEAAAQMASQNSQLQVYLHSPTELRAACDQRTANQACFWVAPNGGVTPF
jgi:hypothetical protein